MLCTIDTFTKEINKYLSYYLNKINYIIYGLLLRMTP